MKLGFRLNGKDRSVEIPPGEVLLDTLHRLGLRGTREGCREGTCGTCTVLVDGIAAYSCSTFTALLGGAEVTTIEGLGTPGNPHPIQRAFVEGGAIQCGYCTPGTILSVKALLDARPEPKREDILAALDGNHCRCTGHIKRVESVIDAARRMSDPAAAGGAGDDGREAAP